MVNTMKNTTTALIASTLLTAVLAGQAAIAGQDIDDGFLAAHTDTSSEKVNYIIDTTPISAELDAELFPTDQPTYPGIADDKVNYYVESAPISAELDAELFPDYNR